MNKQGYYVRLSTVGQATADDVRLTVIYYQPGEPEKELHTPIRLTRQLIEDAGEWRRLVGDLRHKWAIESVPLREVYRDHLASGRKVSRHHVMT